MSNVEVVVKTTFRDGRQMFITGQRRTVHPSVFRRNRRFLVQIEGESEAVGPSETKESPKKATKKRKTKKGAASKK